MAVSKLHVVVGIVRNNDHHILIAKRPAHKPYGGYWEFPGGKIETDELVFYALQREFFEELDVNITSATSWFQFSHHYPDRIVLLDVWKDIQFTGIPVGKEGQELRWIKPQELNQYQFPEGNKIIIERLR